MRKNISTFSDFIRLKIVLYIVGIAAIGYLSFNPLDMQFFIICASIFFMMAATYAYNQITDTMEDLLNRKRINPFVSRKGVLIIYAFILLGSVLSLSLGIKPFLFWASLMFMCLFYSKFRLKRVFPIKNIYTGAGTAFVFLYGASPYLQFSNDMIIGYILVSIITTVVSLLGDIRDMKGDMAVGIRTIPVVLGEGISWIASYLLLFVFSISTLLLSFFPYYITVPFAISSSYWIGKKHAVNSQSHLLVGFALSPLLLIFIRLGEVVL
ncbi:MAG: UbiA family prenyltransferase [Candidatus Diapherotrites archaeon]|nr:UbiA family prenyltransferase [Candidatus Diapherotrites archaeon]